MDDPSFYGLPGLAARQREGGAGCGRPAGDGGDAQLRPDAENLARGRRSCARCCRARQPIHTKTCLYTLTPDRDFIIDRKAIRMWRWPWAPPCVQVASVIGRLLVIVRRGEHRHGPVFRRRPYDPARREPGGELSGCRGFVVMTARKGWLTHLAVQSRFRLRRLPPRQLFKEKQRS